MPIDTRDWYREECRRKHPEEHSPPLQKGKRVRTCIWIVVGIAIFATSVVGLVILTILQAKP